ncbi:MogA/MoaB family molybdenum cofactor biosynthesis protein [Acidipila sp. EB88]|nr:MogA/MoaB family molybdenum cofactor biosynthesis protein [Acidipila sp. EB88]
MKPVQQASSSHPAHSLGHSSAQSQSSPASTSEFHSFPVSVITVSDSCARGERVDLSGPAVVRMLEAARFPVVDTCVIADEQPLIEDALRRLATQSRLVVTTGGTGLSVRDVTPEATRAVCGRLLDGLAEQMRAEGLKETPFAVLSRGVCGLLGATLVINLPGSPQGAVCSLRAVLPVLPHALRLVVDANTPHPVPHPASHPAPRPVDPTGHPGVPVSAPVDDEGIRPSGPDTVAEPLSDPESAV